MFVASYSAAELVQITQPKPVSTIDNNCIGIGNIQAAFDNGRRKQNVGFAINEFRHDFLQIVAMHLAMANDNASVRDEPCEFLGHHLNRSNSVVKEENLTAAIQLAVDRITDDSLIVLRDDGLDRQPIMRRGLNRAHVTG